MKNSIVTTIDEIFNPRSIAVTGVSAKSNRLGNLLLYSFMDMGFKGKLYAVNSNEEEVMGIKCIPSVGAIDGPVDLVIISVHPSRVPALVDDCIAKGVKAAVVFSSGFREKGDEGGKTEELLVQRAREGGMRIIGPNCMGLYSPSSGLSFFPGMPKEEGKTAFLSQSGSLANMLGISAGERGIRFSRMISVGNAADLDMNDFLEYLESDEKTELITLYLEGIADGRRFLDLAARISPRKPILIWKVGRTEGGRESAASHTGSLSGSEEIWKAAIRQAGLIAVENLQELGGFITAFQNPHIPQGNRVAILSGPGGIAVSTADACYEAGLKLASLSDDSRKELSKFVPEFGASVANPVDLSLSASFDHSMYPRATAICGADENVDMIVEFIPILHREVAEGLLETQAKIKKPIAVVTPLEFASLETSAAKFFGTISREELSAILKRMYDAGISVHSTEQEAAKALSSLLSYTRFRKSRLGA
ncbi:MAG TPA: CoA-binding protein [Spirochaetota bacterium]|nr:CoA-binding protein [Spirochaetota bacterium]